MKAKRIGRIEDLLVQEISGVLMNRIKDPRIGMVTITGADVSPDMRNATIYYSVMGSEQEKNEAIAGLTSATPFVRREIAQAITIRNVPYITFVFDGSAERAARVDMLLKGLAE